MDERGGRRAERRVQFRDDNNHIHGMPTAWTSLAPVDPLEEIASGRALFRADDLVRLAEIVAWMRR